MDREYYDSMQNLHGALRKAHKPPTERHPNYFGSIKIQKIVYRLSGWLKEDGSIYLRAGRFDEKYLKDLSGIEDEEVEDGL